MTPGGVGLASEPEQPRSLASLIALGCAAAVVVAILLALGTWQVQRRAWKLDLIARVDGRIHAAPTVAPPPPAWPGVSVSADEYRHVSVTGTFVPNRETLVQAVTDFGPGFWDVVPFRTTQGWTVLVNRGFVPSDWRDRSHDRDSGGQVETVTGLLRLTEPGGAFLRHNDPADDRWYSRDVAAIATKRGLGDIAPYFIDADGTPQSGRYPIGGLTVVSFPNNHLVYAITWYGLAVMLVWGMVWVGRDEMRRRQSMSGLHPAAGRR